MIETSNVYISKATGASIIIHSITIYNNKNNNNNNSNSLSGEFYLHMKH